MELTPWIITAFTVATVYLLEKWENKYLKSIFDWIPAILLAYVIPAIVSAVSGRNYADDQIHQFSSLYFIPLAIIAVMSSLSLKQLRAVGWKPILIFASGSLWIALFPVAFVLLFNESFLVTDILLDQGYWKGIPPVVGSWIGGSTSQLVLKELVQCPEDLFLIILVLDTLLVNIWTILMFQGIKKSQTLNSILGISKTAMPVEISIRHTGKLKPFWCAAILFVIVLMTNIIIDSFVLKIILLSVIGLLMSNLFRIWNFSFALKLGSVLILIVMAVLGLKLTFSLFEIQADLLSFLIVWLVSHFIIMLLVAKSLNVNLAWVPIASMANVGGIATAPAVTSAYEKKWMPHAILLAILSMATGTFWGMFTIYLLQHLMTS